MSAEWALMVPCPRCGAATGERCRLLSRNSKQWLATGRRYVNHPHKQRRIAARP